MQAQTKSPARKGEAGVHCGGEPGSYTKNRSDPQSNCAPEVVVYRRGGSVFVMLANRPWGWPCPDKQFVGANAAGAAERYAARLKGKLAAAAKKEAARRERQWQARIREAEERHAAALKGGA